MNPDTFTILAAEMYMHGGRFALDDTGQPLIIHPDEGTLPGDLIAECQRHGDQIAQLVLHGISRTLGSFQPTLDGLDRVEATP